MFAGIETAEINPRRRWTAVASFTLQAAAAALVLVIPLLRPMELPEAFSHRRLFVPITGAAIETAANPPVSGNGGLSALAHAIFVKPGSGFHFPGPSAETDAVAPPTLDVLVPGNGYPGPNLGTAPPPEARLAPAPPLHLSRPMQGHLIHRVEPIYPNLAKITGVQGAVLIKAVISTGGRIEKAQVVSGSPLLAKAALDAIQQWRYRPYLLNDKPVEVETEITVNFYLTR